MVIIPFTYADFEKTREKLFTSILGILSEQDRKLLLSKRELKKLQKKVITTGSTIIPTSLFINSNGFAKIEIAVAKGKKYHDKRQDLRQKDDKRDMDRLKKTKYD